MLKFILWNQKYFNNKSYDLSHPSVTFPFSTGKSGILLHLYNKQNKTKEKIKR